MERIQVFAIIASAAVCIIIVELVRKKKLMEKYSLIWIFSAVILITLSLWRNLLEGLANFLGIYYAPTALFIVLSFCGLGLLVHFSIAISKLTEQNKILAQEVALLKNEVQTKNESGSPGSKSVKSKRTLNEQE